MKFANRFFRLLSLLTLSTYGVAHGQILQNGSFELGVPDVNGAINPIPGWTGNGTTDGSRFGYVGDSTYTAQAGGRLAVFNGGNTLANGVISQSFATTPGQAYLLEFSIGVVGTTGNVQQLAVTVQGNGILFSGTETVTATSVNTASTWSAKGRYFVADSATTTLTFADASAVIPSVDLLLDDVRVTASSALALTVTSSPAAGIAITAAPADLAGNGDGTTSFSRAYLPNEVVTLTAPLTSGAFGFVKWRKGGVDFSTDAAVMVTMDANHTLDAVYISNNGAPVANPESYAVAQDTQLVVPAAGVLANDTDPESAVLTTVQNAGPAHGSLTLNANGSFSYTPTAGYTGLDSFTYQARDGVQNSSAVTVTLTVTATGSGILANGSFEADVSGWTVSANPAPFAYNDATYVASDGIRLLAFNGGGSSVGGVISQGFQTIPGQTYALSFALNAVGNGSQQLATQVTGLSTLLSVTDSVTGQANSISPWPTKSHTFIANSTATLLTFTDVSATGINIDLLLDHVRIVASASRTLAVTSSPATGISVTVAPADLGSNGNGPTDFTRSYADGAVVSLTAPLSSGPATFVKWQQNGVDLATDAAVSVTMDANHTLNAVYFVNAAPVAVADSYSATQNVALSIAAPGVLANDTDAESSPLSAVQNSAPAHGILTLNLDGSFTYTPASGYLGPDSFTYRANDGQLNSAVVTVNIAVGAPNSLSNGSFELGTTGWTVSGNQFVFDAGGDYNATDGVKLMVFNGANALPDAVISQAFATNPNQPYKLEFDMKVVGNSPNGQKLGVSVSGTNPLLSAEIPVPGASAYQTRTFTFVADSASTTLTLSDLSLDTAGIDTLIDNVRVTAGVVRTLTVSSSLGAGVTVTASPADLGGNGNGTTLFTRSYIGGTAVNLTAQAVAGGGAFLKWQRNGTDYAVTAATTVTVDADTTMTAIYSGNAAPVAVADSFSVNEDASLTVPAAGVLANDTDPESAPISAVLVTTTARGLLVLAPDGGFTYTPDANFNGTDSFTYHTTDGELISTAATATITVVPVNDPPTAVAQSVELNEDTPTAITLTGTDVLDGDPLMFTIVDQPLHGTLSGTSPALIYTPASNYNGPDSFTFVANDGTVNSAPATVSLTVLPVDDIPVAVAQSVTLTGATSIAITLVGSDPDGTPVTYSVTTPPLNGSLSGTGSNLIYTPRSNYVGPDSFTFTTLDGTSSSLPATVSITVSPILLNGSFEDGVIGTGLPTAGLPLSPIPGWTATGSYEVANTGTGRPATQGTKLLVLNTTNQAATAVLTQTFATTPGQPYVLSFDVGSQAFGNAALVEQRLEVALAGNTLETVAVTRTSANPSTIWITPSPSRSYAFVANSAATTLTLKDKSLTSTSIDLLLDNVKVTAALTHSLAVASTPASGVSVTVSPADTAGNASGVTGFTRRYLAGAAVTLTAPAAVGATNFQKWVKNGVDFAVTRSTIVTMDGSQTMTAVYIPNVAPIAVADTYSTPEDVTLVVPATTGVLVNDSDPDSQPLTAVVDLAPTFGTLVLAPNGSFTYTPNANFNGSDSFTYRASDGVVNSASVSVSLTVQPVNDAPVAAADSYTATEDVVLTVPAAGLLANDTDIEGNALGAALVTGPANGGVLLNANGSFVYTPALNFHGIDSFTYRANDGAANSPAATVSITVNPVNDAPSASAQSVSAVEDVPEGITLTGSDVDGNALTFAVVSQPLNGVLSGTLPNLTYTPAANFNGTDSFTFKVSDGIADSAPATVTIDVAAVNDVPSALAQSVGADEDVPEGITLTGSDVDGNALTFAVVSQPLNGVLSGTAPNLTYTPAANFSGTDSFTFTANDGGGTSAPATVTIDVAAVNDAPSASAQSVSAVEDVPKGITLTGSDVDGNALTFAVVAPPLNGVLSGTLPNLTYTPAANFNGPDSFTFKVSDGIADSAPATVTINVAPLEEFSQWAEGFGIAPSPSLDSDGDSLSNAIEYVVGGNPANGVDTAKLPGISLDDDDLIFTYRRTELARTDPSLAIVVEWQAGLGGPWVNSAGTAGVVSSEENDGAGAGIDLVTVRIPRSLAVAGKLFARLRVVVATP